MLWIDAETSSECPLDLSGLDRYWNHPSTFPHCLGVAFDDEPVQMLKFWPGGPETGGLIRGLTLASDRSLWDRFGDAVQNGELIVAHNAPFEQRVLKRLGIPFKRSQIRCSLFQAATAAYPLALNRLALAVGLPYGKHAGRADMLELCVPNPRTGKAWRYAEAPEKFERMYQYCAQDIELMRECWKRLPAVPDEEWEIWEIDQEINERGFGIDLRAAAGMAKLADSEMERLNAAMREVTANRVPSTKHYAKLAQFLGIPSVAKDPLEQFVHNFPAYSGTHPAQLQAAEIQLEASKASVLKVRPAIQQTSEDSRYRNAKQANAAGTGRWGGRGFQPDNLPAGTLKWTAEEQSAFLGLAADGTLELLPAFLEGRGSCKPMDAIKQCIRGLIIASPGHELIETDFTAVETVLGAWTVGDFSILDVFFGDGKIYERQAQLMSGIPYQEIKKGPLRQDAKIWVLSAQYQAGAERLYNSACENARKDKRTMEMTFEDAERHTAAWREAHPAFPKMWKELEKAAKLAVKNPGERFVVHLDGGQPIVYCMLGYEEDTEVYLPTLFCKLPSGRVMHYPFPKIETVVIEKGKMAGKTAEKLMYRVVDNKQWVWTDTYGGKLFENVIQGMGACCLRWAIRMINGAGIPIVTTTHDSALTETRIGSVSPQRIEELMRTPAPWQEGLPLQCSASVLGGRYRKE